MWLKPLCRHKDLSSSPSPTKKKKKKYQTQKRASRMAHGVQHLPSKHDSQNHQKGKKLSQFILFPKRAVHTTRINVYKIFTQGLGVWLKW
jgi:hypothetical protein